MGSAAAGPVTEWLSRWHDGRREALDHILPLVYDQLRQAARRQLRRDRPGGPSATTVVHEVYLRLLAQRVIQAEDRQDFLIVAACTMRRVLVDLARRRLRVKRGSGILPVPLDDDLPVCLTDAEADEVLALDQLLERLEGMDGRAAAVVEHRVFAGLTLEETAVALRVSTKTVQRDWATARAWLRKELGRDLAGWMSGSPGR